MSKLRERFQNGLEKKNEENAKYVPEILQFKDPYLRCTKGKEEIINELGITNNAVLNVGYCVRFT